MLISHGLKPLCVDSTCSVICALGQPSFCFLSLSRFSLLKILCEDIFDCPALSSTTHCLYRTSFQPALLLDIPLCDALSNYSLVLTAT